MPTLKVFTGHTQNLPRPWLNAIRVEAHVGHADMVAVAHTKRALVEALRRCALDYAADRITDELRLQRPPYMWVPLREMLAAEVASPDAAGIFIFQRFHIHGTPVVRVDPGGALVTVGHFGRDRTRGTLDTIVIPVEPVVEDDT